MSFTVKDYEDVFAFARSTFFKTRNKSPALYELAQEACKVMDMVESVIGQQDDRPTGSLTPTSIKDRADI